ncbi:MAG: MoaD/ThiS family protein [Syntrophales bacterium]|jgi:molybdopterin converting factor small subunit|nr:MoaD/ThiS family protein [Syntrophales bacterium]
MSIKTMIHPFLNDGKELQLEIDGNTVGECLRSILQQYPAMEKKMFDKKGRIKGYIEVLVNDHGIGTDELAYAVKDGDSMTIIVFLSGG